jgi:hypothetical protein
MYEVRFRRIFLQFPCHILPVVCLCVSHGHPSEVCMLCTQCIYSSWANFRTELPTRNEKCSYRYIDMTANTLFCLNTLDFYLWGHSITVVYSAWIGNGQTLQLRIFVPDKPFATACGPQEGDCPLSDCSLLAFICWTFWVFLLCVWIVTCWTIITHSYWIVNVRYKCIVSVVTKHYMLELFIFDSNIAVKHKNHSIPDIYLCEPFSVFCCEGLKFV